MGNVLDHRNGQAGTAANGHGDLDAYFASVTDLRRLNKDIRARR